MATAMMAEPASESAVMTAEAAKAEAYPRASITVAIPGHNHNKGPHSKAARSRRVEGRSSRSSDTRGAADNHSGDGGDAH